MGDGSDSKHQLGRILLRRNAVSPDELERLTEDAQSDDARLLAAAAQEGIVDPGELLSALSEQHGSAAVDLRRVVVPLSPLRLVSLEAAERYGVLPLAVDAERLYVAVSDPGDGGPLEGLARETGKTVVPYLALSGDLRAARRDAYASAESGAQFYCGPLAPPAPEGEQRPSLVPSPAGRLEGGGIIAGLGDDLSRPLMFDPIDLPLSPGMLAPEPAPESARRRVLVVDDSDDIRKLLVRVLRERDFEVFESASGLDALEQVREHEPDVMVLDAMLPEIHGFDICRRIKGSRRYGHIPIVMVSAIYRGWRFAEDLRSAYGVDAFLEKPFRIGDMLAAVETALQGRTPVSEPPDMDPLDGPAASHLQAGIDAYARGDVAEAIGELKQGLDENPLAFRLHYHLGLLYGKQDNVFDAIQSLETAVGLRPRDFSTLKNLAVLYQRAGFRLKATEMWQRALSAAPDDDVGSNIKKHLVSLL